MLAALARWNREPGRDVPRFMATMVAALQSTSTAAWQPVGRSDDAAHSFLYPMNDATAALLKDAPLLDSLRRNPKALTGDRIRAIARRAIGVLSVLVDLAGQRPGSRPSAQSRLVDRPALAVVRRPLEYRFVLPLWAFRPSAGLQDRSVPGWGQWHPVVRTLDDLLTWATANVLVSDALGNIGRCEECGRYYVSGRRGRHRFCAGTSCRDRYWGAKSGAARSRKFRARRRELLNRAEARNHIHGDRQRLPRPKQGRGQKPTNGGPS